MLFREARSHASSVYRAAAECFNQQPSDILRGAIERNRAKSSGACVTDESARKNANFNATSRFQEPRVSIRRETRRAEHVRIHGIYNVCILWYVE